MNKIIKIALLLLVAAIAKPAQSHAQTGPVVCKIKYAYDVSGNRIKREYKCENSWSPWDPMPWQNNNTIFTTLSPNPTTGVVTGVFSSPIGGEAGGAYITVSTMGGISVFEQQYNQVMSSVSIDLSQQIPGQYMLTVAAFNKIETYVITKL